jgi:hypothetical protein
MSWLTRKLDVYSDWAAQPCGLTLRIGSWVYPIQRRDWLSVATVLAMSIGHGLWVGSLLAFAAMFLGAIMMWMIIDWFDFGAR